MLIVLLTTSAMCYMYKVKKVTRLLLFFVCLSFGRRIVNVLKVYIESNNLQLFTVKMLTYSHFAYFAKRRAQCNIGHETHIRKFRTQTTSVTVIAEL